MLFVFFALAPLSDFKLVVNKDQEHLSARENGFQSFAFQKVATRDTGVTVRFILILSVQPSPNAGGVFADIRNPPRFLELAGIAWSKVLRSSRNRFVPCP